MRKKVLYIYASLIFVLLLSSCNSVLITDDKLIKDTIVDFFSALNNKDWDLARSYCVFESDIYDSVSAVEENVNNWSSECNSVTLYFSPDVSEADINGKYALAPGFLTTIVTCDDKEPHEETEPFIISLKKIGNSWKLLVVDFSISNG